MEVKINKEIRDYTEAIFFGLSLRQFIFSGLACGIAVGLYFLLHPYMSMETVSWICVLGAAPCVVFGFVKYHGMTAGQLTQEDLVQENSRHQFLTEMCTRKELLS